MSETRHVMSRSEISRVTKQRLVKVLARRARMMTRDQLKAMCPYLDDKVISMLRQEAVDRLLGLEKLLYIAERIGVSVDVQIAEAA